MKFYVTMCGLDISLLQFIQNLNFYRNGENFNFAKEKIMVKYFYFFSCNSFTFS